MNLQDLSKKNPIAEFSARSMQKALLARPPVPPGGNPNLRPGRLARLAPMTTTQIVLVVLCICSPVMLYACWTYEFPFPSWLEPLVLALVVTLALPSALHGAIAGERENRTWDLLRVAPLTKSQIVLGKASAGVRLVSGALQVLSPLVVISLITNSLYGSGNSDSIGTGPLFVVLLASNVLIVGYASALIGLCMWVSAINSRKRSAIACIHGAQFVVLALLPMLPGSAGADSSAIYAFHPYTAPFAPYEVHDGLAAEVIPLLCFGFTYFVAGFLMLTHATAIVTRLDARPNP